MVFKQKKKTLKSKCLQLHAFPGRIGPVYIHYQCDNVYSGLECNFANTWINVGYDFMSIYVSDLHDHSRSPVLA